FILMLSVVPDVVRVVGVVIGNTVPPDRRKVGREPGHEQADGRCGHDPSAASPTVPVAPVEPISPTVRAAKFSKAAHRRSTNGVAAIEVILIMREAAVEVLMSAARHRASARVRTDMLSDRRCTCRNQQNAGCSEQAPADPLPNFCHVVTFVAEYGGQWCAVSARYSPGLPDTRSSHADNS